MAWSSHLSLIDCPECSGRVSSHAWACPHCGFPVFDYGQQTVEEITSSEHVKTGRQRSALVHLARWARAYAEQPRGAPQPFAGPEERRERWRLRIIAAVLAVVIVAILLLLNLRSVNG